MISSSPRDKHGGAEHRCLARMTHQRSRQAIFDRVHALRKEGRTVIDIVRQTGLDRRTIAKWIRAHTLPLRNASAPKTSSPRHFEDYLSRRWAEGCVRGRRLFQEIEARGYTGSFSNLERLLAKWRAPKRKVVRPELSVPRAPAVDPATGRAISPIVAAALCVKPWIADEHSSCKGRHAEKRIAGLRRHAPARDAVSRNCAKQEHREACHLVEGRAAVWTLRDATVRPHIAQGHRRCEKWDHRDLEQRPNRRADQSSENSQTSHVWPSRPGTSARADVALVGASATESEAEPRAIGAFTEAASSASAVTGTTPNSATRSDYCGERA
jgi:hypothetical protein